MSINSSVVELAGECFEADVRQRSFQIWIEQAPVQVPFEESQEAEVTRALKEHRSVHVRVRGTVELSPSGKPLRFTTVETMKLIENGETESVSDAPRIEDELAELTADIPDSEWSKLPPDLLDRFDHYTYDE